MVGRREEKRREERERRKGRVKGRKELFYCEGLRVWLVFFIGWRDYVALSRTEREGLSWFGIERDMETTIDLLYTEKAPNTTPFFCFGVRVCIFMQLRCQKTPYPVILYVQCCKRKIIGCLASNLMTSYVIYSLSLIHSLTNPY
ncbi:hypothetical protein V8G54_017850, partial [Vigna mungo]